ncbi:MAG: SDR family oxidoreductase [Dinoroseobacter sp.]|nr:SDR family oxidoreductase [Dinoroseobacter sp.]
MSRPKLLITGGSGLLALNWAAFASDRYDVTLVLHQRLVEVSFASSIQVDLADHLAVSRMLSEHEADVLVNCAAMTSVEACEAAPAMAHAINADLPQTLAAACQASGVAYVQISTDHLFSGASSFSRESDPVNPQNEYAKSKLAGEVAVLQTNANAIIARTNFFGWGTTYRRSFSDWILSSLDAGADLNLFEDAFFSPIYIRFVFEAVDRLLRSERHGLFNCCGNDRLSKYEFGLILAKAVGYPSQSINRARLTDREELVKRPLDMSLSPDKLSKTLGVGAPSLADSIAAMFADAELPEIKELRRLK